MDMNPQAMQGAPEPKGEDESLEHELHENEDGTVDAVFEDLQSPPMDIADHFSNLADEGGLSEDVLRDLGVELLEKIEHDAEARKKRDEQYQEGLQRTGLDGSAPGGASFPGASTVVHPMLLEAAIDFSSRVVKELFPANGPVRDKIFGKVTREKTARAKRKTEYLNWQLIRQMTEFRDELEQMLTQVPMAGAAYMKFWRDQKAKRPRSEFVPLDDILLPFSATSFYTAQRKTHRQTLTRLDFEERVMDGTYVAIELAYAADPERTAAGAQSDKIEGRESSGLNEDDERLIYETYALLELEPDVGVAPYIVSIDEQTTAVIGVYRNWKPGDRLLQEIQWIIEFPLVPWRGAYPLGLPQMIGSLSGAATGALRALLDSAYVNVFPTAYRLKASGVSGQVVDAAPAAMNEIEGNLTADDIRKTLMVPPFNPPPPVLFQLLGFLVDAGKGVIRTAFDDIAEQRPDAPVGTTMALIEQGSVVFSSIHTRMHHAMARALRTLQIINFLYLDERTQVEELGELVVLREDFENDYDVVPVSDPRIFSDTQRYAQVQAIAARAAGNPLYDPRAVEERILEQLKIPDPEELLVKIPQATPMNAMNENLAASMGRPIMAFAPQEHLSHLQVHLDFLTNPVLGSFSIVAMSFIPQMLEHIKQHLVFFYAAEMYRVASEAVGKELSELIAEDEGAQTEMSRLLALTSQKVAGQNGSMSQLQTIPPIVEQAQQLLKQYSPPQPMDPTQALMADVQRKAQADQQKAQLDAATMQQKAQFDAMKAQAEQMKMQLTAQQKQMEMQQKFQLQIAALQQKAQQAQIALATKQMEMARSDATDRAKLALEVQALEQEAARAQAEITASWAEMQAQLDQQERERVSREATVKYQADERHEMNVEDNLTAIKIAQMEIASGNKVGVSTGTGINPG